MQARELIEILKIFLDFRVNKIAKELDVTRFTVWKWSKGVEPRNKHHIELLKKLIESSRLNVEHEIRRLRLIKNEIEKMKKDDWSNLIRGTLFHLKMTQKQLGGILGVKANEVSRKLNQKRCMLLRDKIRLFSFVKEKRESVKDLIELGKEVDNSIIVDGCLVNKENSKRRSEITGSLFIIKDNRSFLNSSLLFPSKFHRNEIKFIFNRDNAIVFWENKFGEPFPLRLPKLIETNDTFLVGLGIFIAEGTKTERKPKITNSEPVIVQQGVKFFEHIGIDKKKLCGWVQVHERSPCKDENKLKRFWSNVSGLTIDQIKNVWIKPDRAKVKKVPVKEMGTFHLECNLILSRLLIDEKDSEISICGFRNLQRSHEIDIFQFHPIMKRRLANGLILLLQSNIPGRNKERMIELLNRSEIPLTIKEISQSLNLNRSNVNKHLLGLFRTNKISRKEGSGSIPHKWFIDKSDYFTHRRNDISSFFDRPSFMS